MLISTYRAETNLTLAHLDFDLYLQKDPGKVNEFYNNSHGSVAAITLFYIRMSNFCGLRLNVLKYFEDFSRLKCS